MQRGLGKFMMNLRMESKQLENQGKPPLSSPDVVQTADFTFADFSPLGHVGDSGPLLLARQKGNRQNRYVVKHALTDCACNEYVYTKLAQAMGYTMPEAVLFQLSPTEKRRYFFFQAEDGIRDLDLKIKSPSYAQIREMAINWKEYFSFGGMYAMFGEGDSFETPLAEDNKIYRIDTTDAFPISNFQLDFAGINRDFGEGNLQTIWKKELLSSNLSNALSKSGCDSCFEICQEKDKSCIPFFFGAFCTHSGNKR